MMEHSKFNIASPPELWREGVTIGIPLYNEELFIEAAIRSAAPQCEVLLVADNCSSDRSADICQALAVEYPNLIFIRHARNLGAAGNFKFVMSEAKTAYFMWLGAHDLIPPAYVQHLRESLDKDSAASLAFGASTHVDRYGNKVKYYEYAFAQLLADEDPAVRLHAIIKYLSDCSLIHGLFRASHLRAAWSGQDMQMLRADHVLLASLVLRGKFLYVPATSLLRRDVHISDSPSAQLERITGKRQAEGSLPSSREMQESQYELASEVSRRLGWRAPLFRFSAYYWLASRFGPFSERKGKRMIEMLLYLLSISRARRCCRRGIHGVIRLFSQLNSRLSGRN